MKLTDPTSLAVLPLVVPLQALDGARIKSLNAQLLARYIRVLIPPLLLPILAKHRHPAVGQDLKARLPPATTLFPIGQHLVRKFPREELLREEPGIPKIKVASPLLPMECRLKQFLPLGTDLSTALLVGNLICTRSLLCPLDLEELLAPALEEEPGHEELELREEEPLSALEDLLEELLEEELALELEHLRRPLQLLTQHPLSELTHAALAVLLSYISLLLQQQRGLKQLLRLA